MSRTKTIHVPMNSIGGLTGSTAPRTPTLLKTLRAYWQRARQRHDLANLDHRMLQDIGLTAREALAETEKPFWLD